MSGNGNDARRRGVVPGVTSERAWHGVELRHLAALQAVAQERSFSAAAARLGYTQSAISGQILALERVIGARLFERIRGSRPVQLTDEGKILLTHAAAITARLDAARADIGALRAGSTSALRIGTFQSASRQIVPETLRRLAEEDAGADVELRESYDLNSLLDLLEKGAIDLAFTVLPTREGPFETAELYCDEHVLVVRRSDPLASRGLLSLEELESIPVITVEDCRVQSATEIAISASGRRLTVSRRLEDLSSILAFVSAGLGVGFVPEPSTDLPPELTVVRLGSEVPRRVVALTWHSERTLSPRGVRFVELATAVAGAAQETRKLLRAI